MVSSALVEAVSRFAAHRPGEGPFLTGIDGLFVLRNDTTKPPSHVIHRPALCVVVQGAKWSEAGDVRLHYAAGHALLVSLDIPATGCVVEASPEKPFLGVVLELDLAILREVIEQMETPPAVAEASLGLAVIDIDEPLSDCMLRAMRLTATPEAAALLLPPLMREICYWLLAGPQGGAVARLAAAGSRPGRLIEALHMLRGRFRETVRIAELAEVAQLSASAFHRQFKALTGMTPLQYQKRLRLIEARRLIIGTAARAESAAYAVGYESPSQFSRDYVRMFGMPPARDGTRLRRQAA
ncbi:AraC family transcriptional regulator [Kaistia geumhonensis]|uniref:AraC-like DNA-binding protein n=1 Tax=Kaistia geumhonensis TaxID=410839 RepID=A0ABU0M6S2_9HYPH|nr:AraC family transcriptional regulator [Kaistia geumhonensis]MCX5478110.1 AraC family transcriptional regulator [Kaistia geumhonensis]MDQ0516674.1 AraC-like DNA-binding protein [Kaistia geumhonensis]